MEKGNLIEGIRLLEEIEKVRARRKRMEELLARVKKDKGCFAYKHELRVADLEFEQAFLLTFEFMNKGFFKETCLEVILERLDKDIKERQDRFSAL